MTASPRKNTATKAKKAMRKRRPRRELPDDLTHYFIGEGELPSVLDVIAGRGGGSNHHQGNKRYWRRILAERPGYKKLEKNDNTEKNEIAQAIYDYVLSTGGRFLQLDRDTQRWFNLPQKIGLDKIKQALRDKYVPNFFEGEPLEDEPLSTTSEQTEEQQEFYDFINRAPSVPQTDFISTPSIDLGPIFGQSSLEKLDMFKSTDLFNSSLKPSLNHMEDVWNRYSTKNETKSFEFSHGGNSSLDNLMRVDLIATCDNMAQVKSTAPPAPMSLHALLQQQMESAIASSRSVAV